MTREPYNSEFPTDSLTKPVTSDATDANVTNTYWDPSLALSMTRVSSI